IITAERVVPGLSSSSAPELVSATIESSTKAHPQQNLSIVFSVLRTERRWLPPSRIRSMMRCGLPRVNSDEPRRDRETASSLSHPCEGARLPGEKITDARND